MFNGLPLHLPKEKLFGFPIRMNDQRAASSPGRKKTDLIFHPPERLTGCPFTRLNNSRFEFLPARTTSGLHLHRPNNNRFDFLPARTINGLPFTGSKNYRFDFSFSRTIDRLPLFSPER